MRMIHYLGKKRYVFCLKPTILVIWEGVLLVVIHIAMLERFAKSRLKMLKYLCVIRSGRPNSEHESIPIFCK